MMHRWTALKLAIEHGWGGPSSAAKAEELYANLLEWFYTCKGTPPMTPVPLLPFPLCVTRVLLHYSGSLPSALYKFIVFITRRTPVTLVVPLS